MADNRLIAVSITQSDDGTCQVIEHDLVHKTEKVVAVFWADTRMVPVKGKFGPELAARDVAQIRAMIFATTFEKLVNSGMVDLDGRKVSGADTVLKTQN